MKVTPTLQHIYLKERNQRLEFIRNTKLFFWPWTFFFSCGLSKAVEEPSKMVALAACRAVSQGRTCKPSPPQKRITSIFF